MSVPDGTRQWMPTRRRTPQLRLQDLQDRVVVMVLGGLVLFTPPFLLVMAKPVYIAGIPLLYAYLFLTWGGLIFLIARLNSQLDAAWRDDTANPPGSDGADDASDHAAGPPGGRSPP